MKSSDIEKRVAKELGLPIEVVSGIMRSIFTAYKDKLSSVPVDDKSINPNDFNKMNTSCNFFSVGSLVIKGSTIYGRRIKEGLVNKKKNKNAKHKKD